MKKGVYILGTMLVLVMLLSSCTGLFQNQVGSKDTEENVPEGKVFLKMDLSDVMKILKVESLSEYYLVYEDITKSDALNYMVLESTNASLILEKGHIYVIGVADKEKDSDGEEHINMIGILGDDHFGLRCFPVGEEASKVIDLGKLTQDGDLLKSSVSPKAFADMLGYSEDFLKQIAIVDVTFQNFLNPDIDRDGVMDTDQNLKWWITQYFGFNINGDNVQKDHIRFVFWISTKYAKEKYGEDFAMGYDYDGSYTGRENVATLTHVQSGKEIKLSWSRVEFDDYYQWYFDVPEFWDGDYILTVEGSETKKLYNFYFKNLRFYHPERTLKGLIILYPKVTVFSDGKVKEASWEWRYYKDDTLTWDKPLPELLRILANKNNGPTYFYFANLEQFFSWAPGHFFHLFIPTSYGLNPFKDNSIDLSSEDYWVQPGPILSITARVDYQMIGNSDIYYQSKYIYEDIPSNYNQRNFTPVKPESSDNLRGVWYNLYYYSENYEKENLSLDKGDIPAEIEFYQDNTYKAYWTFFNEDENKKPMSEGIYEIKEGSITLYPNDGGEALVLGASISENLLMIDFNGKSVIYSKYSECVSNDEGSIHWNVPTSSLQYEGIWIHDNYDALYKKIEIYDVEDTDTNGDGYYEGKVKVYENPDDEESSGEGTLLIDVTDLSSVTSIMGDNKYNVRVYISDDGNKLNMIDSEGHSLIYTKK